MASRVLSRINFLKVMIWKYTIKYSIQRSVRVFLVSSVRSIYWNGVTSLCNYWIQYHFKNGLCNYWFVGRLRKICWTVSVVSSVFSLSWIYPVLHRLYLSLCFSCAPWEGRVWLLFLGTSFCLCFTQKIFDVIVIFKVCHRKYVTHMLSG